MASKRLKSAQNDQHSLSHGLGQRQTWTALGEYVCDSRFFRLVQIQQGLNEPSLHVSKLPVATHQTLGETCQPLESSG